MDDPRAWKMDINLYGESFESLQGIAKTILGQVVKARSYKELPTLGAQTGGGLGVGYSVQLSCPREHRIKQLRQEADELEKELTGST